MPDPYRPTDNQARNLARSLLNKATFAALAFTVPPTTHPSISRIALATDTDGTPISLISDLSAHSDALKSSHKCALLVGEPEDQDDPLTHPRLTVQATAKFIPHAQDSDVRNRYLTARPTAKLYAGFTDFRFVRFEISQALLVSGFGKAFRLKASDLGNQPA